LKEYNNDDLIKFLLNVLKMIKKPMMEEKDISKLKSMFNFEKVIKQEEEKIIAAPLLNLPAPQGIYASSILK
jgi:hypothetical protein